MSVVHGLRRPAGDETGILRFVFVLLNLHFCFFLARDPRRRRSPRRISPALHKLLRNSSASLSMKGIESPSARASGRHRVAPAARLGLRECQNTPSPRQRAKEDNFCANSGFRNGLFSAGRPAHKKQGVPGDGARCGKAENLPQENPNGNLHLPLSPRREAGVSTPA